MHHLLGGTVLRCVCPALEVVASMSFFVACHDNLAANLTCAVLSCVCECSCSLLLFFPEFEWLLPLSQTGDPRARRCTSSLTGTTYACQLNNSSRTHCQHPFFAPGAGEKCGMQLQLLHNGARPTVIWRNCRDDGSARITATCGGLN